MLRKRLKWILNQIALRHPEAKNNVFEHEVHKVEEMRNMALTLGAKVGACLPSQIDG